MVKITYRLNGADKPRQFLSGEVSLDTALEEFCEEAVEIFRDADTITLEAKVLEFGPEVDVMLDAVLA